MAAPYASRQPSNPRNLLSFVVMKPHCLWHAVPWSLEICSTQRSSRPSSANARRLKSRHPFVPVGQQLNSSSYNNSIRAAQWADHQWNVGWAVNPTRLHIFIPDDTGTHSPRSDPPMKRLGRIQPPPHQCRVFPLMLVQMCCGLLCGLWVWYRGTNHQPCCPSMSNPSTSSWNARPNASGR